MIGNDADTVRMSATRLKIGAYVELTKPRITTLLVIVAAATYVAAGGRRIGGFIATVGTVLAIGAGIFALNQYFERTTDARMVRTKERPVPSGRIEARTALVFGIVVTAGSLVLATITGNALTGAIALGIVVSYLGIYTPLKRVTSFHTLIGAAPGAAPPLVGWAMATGTLDVNAWILFGILFFWQFPHFLAIEMMYAEDYDRAGIRVLPNAPHGRVLTGIEIISTLMLLVIVSILPVVTGFSGPIYLAGALILGGAFLAAGLRVVRSGKKLHARHLLRASIVYLPLIFVFLFVLP